MNKKFSVNNAAPLDSRVRGNDGSRNEVVLASGRMKCPLFKFFIKNQPSPPIVSEHRPPAFSPGRSIDIPVDELSRHDALLSEKSIIDYVKSQMKLDFDREARDVLDLLWQDHYIARDASSGRRKYGFKYKLMRKWWLANRG